MSVDINRGTTGVLLPEEVSSEIWAEVLKSSAVMSLARETTLPGTGKSIQTITGEPEAGWVGETNPKPVDTHTLGNKKIQPYKLAVIEPFSEEFLRDKRALYDELKRRLPFALSKKFDQTVFGHVAAPGSDFDTLAGVPTVSIGDDAWAGLVEADAMVAAAGGMLNGWAIAPQGKSLLLTATDNNNRPLFINNMQTDGSVPALLGQPTHITKAAYLAGTENIVGYGGDWNDAVYGTVEGVRIKFSDQATLGKGDSAINLFEQNMVAILAEIEVGFRLRDTAEFVALTDTVTAP